MAPAEAKPATRRPGKPADPCVMVIFGAAGDLTQRKLIPALYNLAKAGLLPHEFAIVGMARGAMTTDDFRAKVAEDIKHYTGADADAAIWEWFSQRLYYMRGEFQDKAVYPQLKEILETVNKDHVT